MTQPLIPFSVFLLCVLSAMTATNAEDLLTLNNHDVKVGIDRDRGAAITWLSSTAYPKNIVNLADPGRLIQQSYYAGKHRDRTAEGQDQAWSPWAWNPIQGGGVGSWARASEFKKTDDGQTLYSETIPKLWDMPNEEAAARMRQWTSFEPEMPHVVEVRCELTCLRDANDPWGSAALRPQEIPACYFTRNFNQMKSYLGAGQWRDETQTPGPPWGRTNPPQKAMAFFEAGGQGVAVYSPCSQEHWNFGPHGAGRSDDPMAGSCMHVAPLDRVKLGPVSVYRFRYWLILGDEVSITNRLDTLIAKYAQEQAELTRRESKKPNILFIAVDDLNDYVEFLKSYSGTMITPNMDRLADMAKHLPAVNNDFFAAPRRGAGSKNPAGNQKARSKRQDRKPKLADENSIDTTPSKKPNFVIVIGDDHGVYQSSAYGLTQYKTPNMAALANDGIRLTNAYVASPACAPSRAALFTGLMPCRNGIVGNHEKIMKPGVKSLLPVLLDQGYEVVFRGKVGHGRAIHQRGYIPDGVTILPGNGKRITLEKVEQYLVNRKDTDRPIALFIGPTDTHRPWPNPNRVKFNPADVKVPERTFDTPETRSELARYATAVEDTDRVLGRARALAEKYLDVDNTLVMYTSDHGQAWPFGKWSLYETGIRVPVIAAWPGQIKPATTNSAMVSWIDLMPTLIELAGGEIPEGLDGKSMTKVLRGETDQHHSMIFATHKGDNNKNVYPIRSVRVGPWKYIRNLHPEFYYTTHMDRLPESSPNYNRNWKSWVDAAKTNEEAAAFLRDYHSSSAEELYNVEEDPFETTNLAERVEHTETLARLSDLIDKHMSDVEDDKSLSGKPQLLSDFDLPSIQLPSTK